MDDRELVLRYISFRLTNYTNYKPDMDGFLIEGMRLLNALPNSQVSERAKEFRDAMTSARSIFGNDAFRKRYRAEDGRFPINKALFEALSVNLGFLTNRERDLLTERKTLVLNGFMKLCNDRNFRARYRKAPAISIR